MYVYLMIGREKELLEVVVKHEQEGIKRGTARRGEVNGTQMQRGRRKRGIRVDALEGFSGVELFEMTETVLRRSKEVEKRRKERKLHAQEKENSKEPSHRVTNL